jgi:hypothetical protein
MRSSFLILFLVSLLAFSCKNKEVHVPEEYIGRDSMALILTELHLLEGLYVHGSLKDRDSVHTVEAFRKGVMEKFSLTEERFTESYNFYIEHPSTLGEIYVQVMNELSRKKAETEGS